MSSDGFVNQKINAPIEAHYKIFEIQKSKQEAQIIFLKSTLVSRKDPLFYTRLPISNLFARNIYGVE